MLTIRLIDFKYVIVGTGFFGSTIAKRIANDLKESALILESRNPIEGNCFSEIDPGTGIEFHKYGSHIFHTSNKKYGTISINSQISTTINIKCLHNTKKEFTKCQLT